MSEVIAHHPDEALLLAYAGGAADEATSLVLATHLSFCAACRAEVAVMEKLGGALIEDVTPVAMAPDALSGIMARLDAAAPFERPRRPVSRDGTPGPLRAWLGRDLGDVRWRQMGPRLSYVTLLRRGGVTMRLLRGVPGAETGAHTHGGQEYTLVLRGGFIDVTGSYGPGDLQLADGSVLHNPVADPGEDCINLSVTTAPLRFQSLFQKIAAPLFGF